MELEKQIELENRINDLQRQLNEVRAELDFYKAEQKLKKPEETVSPEPLPRPEAAQLEVAGEDVHPVKQQLAEPERARKVERVSVESREAGLGKMAMGIGAVLLILISFSLFAVAVFPLLGNTQKAIALIVFSAGLMTAGTLLHKRSGWWVIPECIGLVGLYLSIIISHIALDVLPLGAACAGVVLWIVLTGVYAYRRELVFGIIEQVGLFCSNILVIYHIGKYFALEERAGYAYLFTGILILVENGMLCLSLMKKNFRDAVPVYIGELGILPVSTITLCAWSGEGSYRVFVLALVLALNIRQYLLRALVNRKMTAKSHAVFMLYNTGLSFLYQACALLSMTGPDGSGAGYDLTLLLRFAVVPAIFAAGAAILPMYRDSFGYKSPVGNGHYHAVQSVMLGMALLTIPGIDSGCAYYELCLILCNAGLFCALAILGFTKGSRINEVYPVAFALVYALLCTDKEAPVYVVLSVCFNLVIAGMAAYRYRNGVEKRAVGYYTFTHITVVISLTAWMVRNAYYMEDGGPLYVTYFISSLCIVALNLVEAKYRYLSNKAARYIISALSSVIFLTTGAELDGALFWIFALTVILVQLTLHTRELFLLEKESRKPYGILICVKYTIFMIYLLRQASAAGIVYSIVFILVSAACMVTGMRLRTKSLRVYGLVLSMISIFKLIMMDIYYDSLVTRALSFLLAGLICLAVSYAYSRFEKTL